MESLNGCVPLANILHSPNNLAPSSPRGAPAQLEDFTHPDLENIWRTASRVCKGSGDGVASSSRAAFSGVLRNGLEKSLPWKGGRRLSVLTTSCTSLWPPPAEVTGPVFPEQWGSGGLPPDSPCLRGVTSEAQPFHLWNVENPACLEGWATDNLVCG